MAPDTTVTNILNAISEYATIHSKLDELQRQYEAIIPRGDQKTGAIGEFYAMLYVRTLYPHAEEICFGKVNNHAWDIRINSDGRFLHIQVKTTSAFAKHKQLSPIHYGWDYLYVLHLDSTLKPDGFWVVGDGKQLLEEGEVYKTCKAPRLDQAFRKSGPILFGPNQIAIFRQALPYLTTS